ncbi:MAG: hypothetical protein WC383_14490 [Gammaproteobacteria bacterium]
MLWVSALRDVNKKPGNRRDLSLHDCGPYSIGLHELAQKNVRPTPNVLRHYGFIIFMLSLNSGVVELVQETAG